MAINLPISTLLYDAGVEINGERIYVMPGTIKVSGINSEMESKVMAVSAGSGDIKQVFGFDITTQIGMLSFDMPNDQVSNNAIQRIFNYQLTIGYFNVKVFYSSPNTGGLFGAMILTSKPERTFSSDATISLEFQGNLYSQ